jgi:soluble lytic murein transglycosylase-like protein
MRGRLALRAAAALAAFSATSTAETPEPKAQTAVARQLAAAERQRLPPEAAVERIAARARESSAAASFFVSPWSSPKLAVAVSSTATSADAVDADCEPLPTTDLDALVATAATRQRVEAALLQAVIAQESGGRPCAVSPKGAKGIMQLMPDTVAAFGVADPFDPAQGLAAGARFLRQLLDRYDGDVRLALAAYNAGPGRVDQFRAVPDIPETTAYVDAILRRLGGAERRGSADTREQPPGKPPQPAKQ